MAEPEYDVTNERRFPRYRKNRGRSGFRKGHRTASSVKYHCVDVMNDEHFTSLRRVPNPHHGPSSGDPVDPTSSLDGLALGVEYSGNKHRRWELLQQREQISEEGAIPVQVCRAYMHLRDRYVYELPSSQQQPRPSSSNSKRAQNRQRRRQRKKKRSIRKPQISLSRLNHNIRAAAALEEQEEEDTEGTSAAPPAHPPSYSRSRRQSSKKNRSTRLTREHQRQLSAAASRQGKRKANSRRSRAPKQHRRQANRKGPSWWEEAETARNEPPPPVADETDAERRLRERVEGSRDILIEGRPTQPKRWKRGRWNRGWSPEWYMGEWRINSGLRRRTIRNELRRHVEKYL